MDKVSGLISSCKSLSLQKIPSGNQFHENEMSLLREEAPSPELKIITVVMISGGEK